MNWKQWLLLLFLQAFGVFWAIWLFSSPISRNAAGLAAGIFFLLVALAPQWLLRKNESRTHWVVFWASLIFLVFSAVPILALRLLFWGDNFNEIVVMGVQASSLHSWSESFYLGMVVATFIDGFRFLFLKKIQGTKKGA